MRAFFELPVVTGGRHLGLRQDDCLLVFLRLGGRLLDNQSLGFFFDGLDRNVGLIDNRLLDGGGFGGLRLRRLVFSAGRENQQRKAQQ